MIATTTEGTGPDVVAASGPGGAPAPEPADGSTGRSPPKRWLDWAGPLLVTLIAGWLRFADLGRPHAVVFDETYYAKDALSLLRFGYEQGAIDDADELLLAGNGDPSTLDIFTGDASFVVHPPAGKWLIAAGEALFGATPFGWRFAVALLGTLSVLMLARAVWNMTGSPLWGSVAGLLLAIDGVAIVMSRTAVLDQMLAFFVLAAFLALLADRRWAERREQVQLGWAWWRPWRLVAAAALGLAVGVKWSGIWYLAAFGLLTVLWEVGRRRRAGQRVIPAMLHSSVPAAITMLGLAAAVYLASWTGWFVTDGGWGRSALSGDGILVALRELGNYHLQILGFHTGLSTEHSYQSPAWGWLIQARPTSFYYESVDAGTGGCGSDNCSAAVLAVGNPLIWWAGILALLHQTWRWFAVRDWRAGAVLAGLLAGWAPWLLFPDRTIFSFYSVVFVPFLVAALTLTLASIANPRGAGLANPRGAGLAVEGTPSSPARHHRARIVAVAVFLMMCVALSWWFYPIWSAEVISYDSWQQRMWLPSWI